MCDCCDGSDENSNIIRCPNNCESLLNSERKKKEMEAKGKKIRQQYINMGTTMKHQAQYMHFDGGMDDAFLPFADKCYDELIGEYTYQICMSFYV